MPNITQRIGRTSMSPLRAVPAEERMYYSHLLALRFNLNEAKETIEEITRIKSAAGTTLTQYSYGIKELRNCLDKLIADAITKNVALKYATKHDLDKAMFLDEEIQ